MKMKKYLILAVVSLIAIVGSAIGTGGTQKPSIDKKKSRLRFLDGVFFAQKTQKYNLVVTEQKMLQKGLRSPLDGIKEVAVKVAKLPETERYGLTRQALQTDTELRLRQHGIKVITEEEAISNTVDLNKESLIELIKQIAYTEVLIDLLDSGQYDKAFKQMKEPEKSLIESLLNEESDQLFTDSVSEYIKLDIKHYKPLYSVAGPPMLHINVRPLVFEGTREAVASIRIEVYTETLLRMGPSRVVARAVLWDRGCIMTRGLDNISEIRDQVKDMVDEFINDYLAANPKEQPTTEKDKKPKDD